MSCQVNHWLVVFLNTSGYKINRRKKLSLSAVLHFCLINQLPFIEFNMFPVIKDHSTFF